MTIVKAVVLGDTEVGKTSFTTRYTTGNFPDPEFLKTTIGASFDTKKVSLPSGNNVTLSIFDFGGQMRFIESFKIMIRGAVIGLLFFDVTRLQTLDNLENYWLPAIEDNSILKLKEGDGKRFIIVGNKIDLIDSERIDFIQSEMIPILEEYHMRGGFISARTGVGFEALDREFLKLVDTYGIAE